MKKLLTVPLLLALLFSFTACAEKKKAEKEELPELRITFPFDALDIEKAEVTYVRTEDGNTVTEKKVVTEERKLKEIYSFFTEKVKLTTKELSPEKGCDTVTFMLILHNATTYDLTYSFIAENSGRLKTKAGWFDCFTEADVIGFWKELKKR